MKENQGFIKCELKFFSFLVAGMILLNIIGMLFQYVFDTALLISIGMSVIVFVFYILYFIFGMFKYVVFKKNYECIDTRKRVAGWLSSLI